MCIPPGTSVPAFARVRDWWAEERGSKPWRPSYVLRESAENWSALDASGAQVDASSCDRAARLCATAINLPLQALHVASTAYENTNAFDPEHPSTPPRDAGLERRGSLSLVSGGPLYLPLEVASVEARRTNQEQQGRAAWQEQQMFLNPDVYMKNEVPVIAAGVEIGASLKRTDFELPIPKFDDKPVADLEKPELGLCEEQPGLRRLLQQPSGAPELESIGSFAAWLDCITKNDTEMEERSLSEERCTKISFEAETKHVKKAPKLTKTEKKNQKTAAAAVHSHEETEDDMCTDDDTEPVLIDEKRKRRMLSNRASAQRSRQRRQDRLDQLEVLTAQLRVENASLLRKSNLAVQLARKFEGENKKLQENANYLSKEVLAARKPATPKLHEDCHSSPNTCTDISEIVGEEDLSPEVELNLEKVPDDRKKPTKSTVSKSYMTVDDQMDMENTSKDTDMTADCSNEKAEKCKTVQVSEVQGAARKVKWDIHRSPVSCKTGSKNTEGFSLPTSLPQANLLSPVKEVPVTIPDLDSRYLLDEICNLFESDSANDPYINNDILNMIDQNWLESFAECLNA